MSHECPRCGLWSPEEASRCDCGYDFETCTVQSSYLDTHGPHKRVGVENLLSESARTDIIRGTLILITAALARIAEYLTSLNRPWRSAAEVLLALWGARLLYRGLRKRHLGDEETARMEQL